MTKNERPPKQGSAEWRELRKLGIGSSDICILAGLTPWGSPYQVWAEKTGLAPGEEPTEAMTRGNILEAPVADWWAASTGKRIRRRHAIVRHPDYDWATASLDREVVGEDTILEVKTTSQRWDGDSPPDHVVAQVVWALGVSGRKAAHVAALTGDLQLRRWDIFPDPDYFADLLAIGEAAWRGICDRVPPAIDGSEATAQALARSWRHPLAVDKVPLAQSDPAFDAIAAALWIAEGEYKEAEARLGTARNAARAVIGDGAGFEGPWGKVSWTSNRDSERVDWEAVARDLGLADPAALEEARRKHTSIRHGSPVLRTHWNEASRAPIAIEG